MLKFSRVAYKNILATGNVMNEYLLDKYPTVLVTGPNGAGKTTVLDAVCFGMYGKPFRSITRGSIINAINEKQLVVEIEFTTQNNHYLIRRGLKPSVFDIICNGTPLPAFPSVAEMQEYLERYILKCNFKAFTQVVILGASSYVPFMRLTPAVRREILEDVLDIEVFSSMLVLNKARVVAVRESLTEAQRALSVIESNHTLAQTYADQWSTQQEQRRAQVDALLVTATAHREALVAERTTPVPEEANWQTRVEKIPEWQDKHTKASKLVARFAAQRQHLEHSHTFFAEHDQCPMCQQEIDSGFKADKVADTTAQLAKLTADHTEARQLVTKFTKRLETAKDAQAAVQSLALHRRQLDEQLKSADRELVRLTDERAQTLLPPPAPPQDLGDLAESRATMQTQTYTKQVLDQTGNLLKDTGIRTRIVQQYLPVINKYVNHYLQAMDFPIQFVLDDQLTETIKSRHRDVFSYENFSEGEKRRIDLALVMTWREVSRLKNSVFTNLLIFDEIFDSSLDAAGTEDLLRLLHALGPDTNVMVISHKDAMVDRFSHTVTVTKDRGFSVVTSA